MICRAGCKTEEVVGALGLKMSDLFPGSTYRHRNGHEKNGSNPPTVWGIRDVEGELQAEHLRYDLLGGGKKCLWRIPGGERWGLGGRKVSTLPLYRSELLKDWPEDLPVVVVEGEPAADSLAKIYPAVLGTITGAEGCPSHEVLGVLWERAVVLWPDADEPGHRHMHRIASALSGIAGEVRIFEWEEAPEKGDAADHPAVNSKNREAVDELLGVMAQAPIWESSENSSSRHPVPTGIGKAGRGPQLLRFVDMEPPGPRRYLLKDLLPTAHFTLLYGDGGVAKSTLALALGLAVAGDRESWMGREVENGPVLYLDFELDADEQARRVWQLCRGAGLPRPPHGLLYMSVLGHRAQSAFEAALEACEKHGVNLLVLDSLGPALQGDAEASRDVIGFFQRVAEPFRALGVAVLIIDHQSKLQAGQSYQSKGAFGSVFKSNLARSVLQVQGARRETGTLTVKVRQKKHNFGPLADPFGIKLDFADETIAVEAIELDAAELAEEETLNTADRMKLVLQDKPAYPWKISDFTGIALKTVRNTLTGLRKQGTVEPTGEMDGRGTQQVRLAASVS